MARSYQMRTTTGWSRDRVAQDLPLRHTGPIPESERTRPNCSSLILSFYFFLFFPSLLLPCLAPMAFVDTGGSAPYHDNMDASDASDIDYMDMEGGQSLPPSPSPNCQAEATPPTAPNQQYPNPIDSKRPIVLNNVGLVPLSLPVTSSQHARIRTGLPSSQHNPKNKKTPNLGLNLDQSVPSPTSDPSIPSSLSDSAAPAGDQPTQDPTYLQNQVSQALETPQKKQRLILQVAKTLDRTLGEEQDPDLQAFINETKQGIVDFLTLQALGSNSPKTNGTTKPKPKNGKSFASVTAVESSAPNSQNIAAPKRATPPPPPSDTRIFVRFHPDSQYKDTHPFLVGDRIRDILKDKPNLILTVQRVRTGFAIVPTLPAHRDTILAEAERIKTALGASRVEASSSWHHVILPLVPKFLQQYDRVVPVSLDLIRQDIIRVTGITPTQVRWTRATEENEFEGAIVAAFQTDIPPKPFQIFCDGPHSRTLRPSRKADLQQCGKCLKWHTSLKHTPDRCWGTRRCKQCGGTAHGPPCSEAPKCANCCGQGGYQ